jgi:hypothetical protein
VNGLIRQRAGMPDLFDVIGNKRPLRFSGVRPKMAAVDENGCFLFHNGAGKLDLIGNKRPLGFSGVRPKIAAVDENGYFLFHNLANLL